MKVIHRLHLAALPSAVGVLTVAALAYWGQYSRAIPEIFLIVAIVATVASFIISWANVRYVARRVERLANSSGDSAASATSPNVAGAKKANASDELDAIEGAVTNLSGAVRLAQDDHARDLARSEQRNREQAQMLSAVSATALQRLDEVRLPIHILLENHFGDLNENQEEMLGAARVAAESVEDELAAMGELAGLELGTITLRRDRVFPADLLNAILPTLRAHASAKHIDLQSEIAPLIPAYHVDAARLQRAMLVLLVDCIDATNGGAQASLALSGDRSAIAITLTPAAQSAPTARTLLARRVIEATGGEIREQQGTFAIHIRI